jgi:DNA modification methylase
MTPYYADDLVTLYHGDCRAMPDMVPEVVVTDPPYGTGAYATDKAALDADTLVWWADVSHSVAVFGWAENLVRLCIAAALPPTDWITWWPMNAGLRSWAPRGQLPREAEHIALWGEVRWVYGAPTSANSDKLVERIVSPLEKARGKARRSPQGRRWADVWRDSSPGLGFQSHQRLHPNEKPVSLMRRLLETVADGTVFDPFAGSGSTLVAAKSLGRKAIGVEIDERYCETAARRCSQEALGLVAA